MNWLQSILQMIGMGGGGASQTPVPESPNAQSGLGTTPAFEQAMGGGQPSATQTALGNINWKAFSHPQAPMQGGHQIPLTQLPEFPQPTAQPSLQNLLAAIQARRQRLAGLGIGQ